MVLERWRYGLGTVSNKRKTDDSMVNASCYDIGIFTQFLVSQIILLIYIKIFYPKLNKKIIVIIIIDFISRG